MVRLGSDPPETPRTAGPLDGADGVHVLGLWSDMLSQKAKYALRAMLALADAREGEALQIADIAERHRIPKRFLEQILLDLKHHRLVDSRRGKFGGYLLIRPPERITFAEIVRIIDGPIAPLPCLSRMAYRRCEDCDGEDACAIRRVYAQAHDATVRVLESTSLADALASGQTNDAAFHANNI